MFDRANGWGLSDILCDRNAKEEIPLDVLVKKTAIFHLYLLLSRSASDNFGELLYSSRMSRLFWRAREEFDYLLMDAPSLDFADTECSPPDWKAGL
jgi:Mrp family chromosome partitioning ATPase